MAATSDKTIVLHYPTVLATPSSWTTVFNFVASGSVFTDITTNANSASTNDVVITGAVGDVLYFGMAANKFDSLYVIFLGGTSPSGGVRVWEYWNGSAWTTLTVYAVSGDANIAAFPITLLTWTPPSDWVTNSINSVTNYWIRARVTILYTVAGVLDTITPGVIPVLNTMTIPIPETTTRTVTSAALKINYHVDPSSASSLTQKLVRVSLKLGAAAVSYVIDMGTSLPIEVGLAVEQSPSFLIDCTSYFSSNLGAGTSQTFNVTFSGVQELRLTSLATAPAIESFNCELYLTYSVDESAQDTRVKTVWIPLESDDASSEMTTSLVSLGTSQIPALDSFLPEASKVYKEIVLVLTANSAENAGGVRTLSYALDSGGAIAALTKTDSIATQSVLDVANVDLSAMTTSTTHDLKLKTNSQTAGRFSPVCAYLMVTYTYSHVNSGSILNSVLYTAEQSYSQGDDSSTLPTEFIFNINIQEPATISNVQSAVMLRFCGFNRGFIVKIGSQANRTYSATAGTLGFAGDHAVLQRIDSGGAMGSALTLARGFQTLPVKMYGTLETCLLKTALLILNYTSAKSSLGAHLHSHTVFDLILGSSATNSTTNQSVTSLASLPTITPSTYWINCFGYWTHWFAPYLTSGNSFAQGLEVFGNIQSTELAGAGWEPVVPFMQLALNGNGITADKYNNKTSKFKRWANDWNSSNLLDPKNSRFYKLNASAFNVLDTDKVTPAFMSVVTYHGITFTATGNIKNYTGNGSGVTVTVHRSDTGEKIATTTTAVGGGYTISDIFDSTVQHFSEARQDGTHLGRSDLYYPT